MKIVLIIVGIMLYFFVGALIGTYFDESDLAMIAFCAVSWPAILILFIPIKLADIVYTKIKRWRLSRK